MFQRNQRRYHVKKDWSDDTPQGWMAPTSKCQQLIIVQVGKEKHFIPGALTTLKPNQMMGELSQRNEQ
jgi:hypothetical protein